MPVIKWFDVPGSVFVKVFTNIKWNASPISLLQYGQSHSCNETPLHLPTSTGKRWFLVQKDSIVLQ